MAAIGLVSIFAVIGLTATAGPVQAAGLPQLALSTSVLTPGEAVSITGTGWPAHKVLQAAVCGGGRLAVSSDCDLTNAIEFGSDNGDIAHVVRSIPPTPCP